MTQPTPLQLAQAAYRAYGGYTGGLTYNGRPMPAWGDLGPTVQGAWIAAAGAVEHDLHTTVREESTVTLPPNPANQVTTPAPAITPTQTLHPWRATVRTGLAATLGLLPLAPAIVDAAGVQAVPWLAGIVGVAAAVTRVLAVPAVNTYVTEYLPWLAPTPRQP